MCQAYKVIKIAESQIGYLEKASNKNLDDFEANAGRGNYTKYARDFKEFAGENLQGQAWCDMFVDWCFVQAYGEASARKLLGGFDAWTPASAQYFKDRSQWHTSKPQAGDVIFFKNSERINHTGIVTKVSDGKVYTVEGNTSPMSGSNEDVVENGGGVWPKNYTIGNSRIAGYGRPAYTKESDKEYITSLYREYLEREPDESGMNTWLNTLASGGSRDDVKSGITHSEEYRRICQAYVSGLYETLLNRTPKSEEINDWVARMQDGSSKEDVRAGFINSTEYRRKYVKDLYKTLLGREPKSNEVDSWVEYLESGMSQEDVKQGFIDSTEYRRNYVIKLYRELLNREPKDSEVSDWVSEMESGMSEEDVKLGFLHSTEYRRIYVTNLYKELLNRTPKSEEVDSWVKCMEKGMSEEDVRLGFINSEEYKRKHQ